MWTFAWREEGGRVNSEIKAIYQIGLKWRAWWACTLTVDDYRRLLVQKPRIATGWAQTFPDIKIYNKFELQIKRVSDIVSYNSLWHFHVESKYIQFVSSSGYCFVAAHSFHACLRTPQFYALQIPLPRSESLAVSRNQLLSLAGSLRFCVHSYNGLVNICVSLIQALNWFIKLDLRPENSTNLVNSWGVNIFRGGPDLK
jgi:hypothetical protein